MRSTVINYDEEKELFYINGKAYPLLAATSTIRDYEKVLLEIIEALVPNGSYQYEELVELVVRGRLMGRMLGDYR